MRRMAHASFNFEMGGWSMISSSSQSAVANHYSDGFPAGSPAAILEAIDSEEFEAVLMDLNYARDTTSGQEGLDLLSQIRLHDPTLPVVVMTAWGSVEVAVEAMRRGARDFIQKPWENARLLAIIRTQIELSQALRRQQRLEAENRLLKPDGRPLLIAEAQS